MDAGSCILHLADESRVPKLQPDMGTNSCTSTGSNNLVGAFQLAKIEFSGIPRIPSWAAEAGCFRIQCFRALIYVS
jgi:hypothetical protein